MKVRGMRALLLSFTAVLSSLAQADPELAGFAYPYPVKHFEFTSQGEHLQMAYMDVAPQKANGRTAVLLHGKNFCAGTWQTTIEALTAVGYRVVAPDQIG